MAPTIANAVLASRPMAVLPTELSLQAGPRTARSGAIGAIECQHRREGKTAARRLGSRSVGLVGVFHGGVEHGVTVPKRTKGTLVARGGYRSAPMTFNETMDDSPRASRPQASAVLASVHRRVRAGRDHVRSPRADRAAIYRTLRSFVGRTILLSLEILVAADLIRTVAVDPSFENVASLARDRLIRTILSFSLDVEIEGRLPWRAHAPTKPATD